MEDLTREFREVLQQDKRKIKDELSRKFDALTNLVADSAATANSKDGTVLTQDILKLQKAGKSDGATNRIRAARRAAEVLANDETTEPLDQLRRVVTPPIRSKLRTLNVNYQPSANEQKAIEADAHDWFRRIADELRKPGHRGRQRAHPMSPPSIALIAYFHRQVAVGDVHPLILLRYYLETYVSKLGTQLAQDENRASVKHFAFDPPP